MWVQQYPKGAGLRLKIPHRSRSLPILTEWALFLEYGTSAPPPPSEVTRVERQLARATAIHTENVAASALVAPHIHQKRTEEI